MPGTGIKSAARIALNAIAVWLAVSAIAIAATVVFPSQGGTGVANNNAATLTRSGSHALTLTTTGTTGLTLPTSGTVCSSAVCNIGAATGSTLALTGQTIDLGSGGTGGAIARILLNGGSGNNAGPYLIFEKNSAVIGYFGAASAVSGGTADTLQVYTSTLAQTWSGADTTIVGTATAATVVGTTRVTSGGRNVTEVLCQSAVQVTAPADTTEDTLYTCTIPANAMGANGSVRLSTSLTYTASANLKTVRVRFGGASGTIVSALSSTATDADVTLVTTVSNRNAANSQYGVLTNYPSFTAGGVGFVAYSGSPAVDTTSSTTLVVTCQKVTAGETCSLERILVELLYGA